MTAVVPHAAAAELLRQLPRNLKNYADFDRAIEALAAGQPASIDGVWGSACALVSAALAQHAPGALVVVLPSQREADDAAGDLELFIGHEPRFFPSWETAEEERLVHDETFGQRLRVLKRLLADGQPSRKSKVEGRKSDEQRNEARPTGLSRFMKPRSAASASDEEDNAKDSASNSTRPSTFDLRPSTSLIVTSIQALLQPSPHPEPIRS